MPPSKQSHDPVCAVVAAKLMVNYDISLLAALVVAMAVGGVLGLLNGLLIAVGRVHPVIITFGTANIFLFIGLRIFDSKVVNNLPPTLAPLGRGEAGRLLGIPISFLLMLIIAAAAWWYLRYAAGGRHLYATARRNSARMAVSRQRRRFHLPVDACCRPCVCIESQRTQSLAPPSPGP